MTQTASKPVGRPKMAERRLVNKALLERLRGTPGEKQMAIDAITEFLRLKAREDMYQLPVPKCPVSESEQVFTTVEGVPIYTSDFRDDADIRDTIWRRVKLHGVRQVFGTGNFIYPRALDDIDYAGLALFLVDRLNAMLAVDQKAITKMIDSAQQCTPELGSEVSLNPLHGMFTMLGFINGLICHGRWRVVPVYDNNGQVIRFEVERL